MGRCGDEPVLALRAVDSEPSGPGGEEPERHEARDGTDREQRDAPAAPASPDGGRCRRGRGQLLLADRCAAGLRTALVEPERRVVVGHQRRVHDDAEHPAVEAEHEVEDARG